MTQEEKQLLFQDLCARLPYGVKGRVYTEITNGKYDINGDLIFFDAPFDVILDKINSSTGELHVVAVGNESTIDFIEEQQTWGKLFTIDEFKPYLRRMSSMTEEEKIEYCDLQDKFLLSSQYPVTDGYALYDWLSAHHFDFRNLLDKGRAIEVTKENNPYNN